MIEQTFIWSAEPQEIEPKEEPLPEKTYYAIGGEEVERVLGGWEIIDSLGFYNDREAEKLGVYLVGETDGKIVMEQLLEKNEYPKAKELKESPEEKEKSIMDTVEKMHLFALQQTEKCELPATDSKEPSDVDAGKKKPMALKLQLLSDDAIEMLLNASDDIEALVKGVKQEATARAINGLRLERFYLKNTGRRRDWSNCIKAAEVAQELGVEPYEKKMITVAAMERMIGEKAFQEKMLPYVYETKGHQILERKKR